jgi:hypothetical protein
MKIAIICLANGPYSIFIDNLINTCEDKFVRNSNKKYFIITDSYFENSKNKNVKVIHKQRMGWPMDCLLRPQYSYELNGELSQFDFVYFFNANMSIYDEIDEDILPDKSGLVGVEHSGFLHRNNLYFTYDRNPKSKAYIEIGKGELYYQACLWGGTSNSFISLSKTIMDWTNEDMNNKIEPIWLDESYLNKYFLLNPPKTLSPYYAWPTHIPVYENGPVLKILQLQKKDYINDENFKYL